MLAANLSHRGAMLRRLLLALTLAFAFAAPAHAAVQVGAVLVDRDNLIRPDLLTHALEAWRAHPEARRDTLAIVDFAKPSPQPRFYIVDLTSGAVEAYRTAHGKGSDTGVGNVAAKFSNQPNSEASSLGAYLAGDRYLGKHGVSLALDGLDATNSNARARAVVLHSAAYMTDDFVAAHARPGRSWGCFVVDPHAVNHVVDRLQRGALIYAGR